MATRDEVLAVLASRYETANRQDRGRILDELVALTGHHRKHAARVLRGGTPTTRTGPRPGRRLYDDAARQALIVVWEAADRIMDWRSDVAHNLVFGDGELATSPVTNEGQATSSTMTAA